MRNRKIQRERERKKKKRGEDRRYIYTYIESRERNKNRRDVLIREIISIFLQNSESYLKDIFLI